MRKSVFIVYGHDIEMRTAVKGYLTSRDIAQVSLEGPINGSNTVIEEFEERADPVSDAIVLLSPDDLNDSGQKKRPRQKGSQHFFGQFAKRLFVKLGHTRKAM
ncbi:TIR domain-containing protein, partial [Lacticaseibacillus paracasei]